MREEVMRALYQFYNQFIPAYVENTVPSGTVYPYLTYNLVDNGMEDSITQVIVYTYSTSFMELANIIDAISEYIGSGVLYPYANGELWIKKGSPFSQNYPQEDMKLKASYITLNISIL